MSEDLVRLDFARDVAVVDADSVTIVLPRDRLPELRAFLAALELGLEDLGARASGDG